jgi:hypothetical protein
VDEVSQSNRFTGYLTAGGKTDQTKCIIYDPTGQAKEGKKTNLRVIETR